MREYTVGVFKHFRTSGKPFYMAYLRDYNPQWEGCRQFKVMARNGRAAKEEAIMKFKLSEQYSTGG